MENQTIQKPLVSIIIPTYNRGYVIENTIQNVFSQTFKDWELIIVDDASNDNTADIVKKFQAEDSRIHFFCLEKNSGGASKPRNLGLKIARGKYIAFLDSDDEWLPEKLERQIKMFNTGDIRLGLVYTKIIFINKKNKETRVKKTKVIGDIFLEELVYNPIGTPSKVMIKSECIKECGAFDENFIVLEDWDLWIRITSKYKVGYIDLPLVNYFESEDSTSLDSDKLIIGYKKLWKKYNILNKERWIKASHFVRLGHRLCYYGNYGLGQKYLWKAVITDPWKPKNVLLFLLSITGSKMYKKMTFIIMKNF